MEKREGAAACGARHVLVAQSGSLQIFDRALGVVREKGIDAEFGIVPPFVFAVGDARKNQYAGVLQACCFGPVRSEERRVGDEWFSTCKSRWSPDHTKQKAEYTSN